MLYQNCVSVVYSNFSKQSHSCHDILTYILLSPHCFSEIRDTTFSRPRHFKQVTTECLCRITLAFRAFERLTNT